MVSKDAAIAIFGAGPSGVTAAKFLLSEGFSSINIFEQQSRTGGAWNYTAQTLERLPNVPLTNPDGVDEQGTVSIALGEGEKQTNGDHGTSTTKAKPPVFLSPMYDLLETNLPKPLMQFNNPPFDHSLPLFPDHEDVARYVQNYSRDIEHKINFSTQVQLVRKMANTGSTKWTVEYQRLLSGDIETAEYDLIVVATGNYSVPYIPPLAGIKTFEKAYPGSIQHSKYFRNAKKYHGKKVVVVGNSASGVDISGQIAITAQLPLLQSTRSSSELSTGGKDPRIKEMPEIASFAVEGRAVMFKDGSVEKNVDTVMFATGYLHSLPFMKDLTQASMARIAHEDGLKDTQDASNSHKSGIQGQNDLLITDGQRVYRMYQHMFYIPDPSLAIMCLPYRVVPFPLSECQSAVIAGVWSGRLELPSREEMRDWEERRAAIHGGGKTFHMLQYPQDFNYIAMLNKWNKSGQENEGLRRPSQWGAEKRWIRETFPKMRKAFVEAKKENRVVTTMEELGFTYNSDLDQTSCLSEPEH